jgi:hypothetical protein
LSGDGARERMESVIRRYFDGCNEADEQKMLECLAPEAAHYFPDGAPQGPFLGSEAIARGWLRAVRELGSKWTIDRVLVDERAGEAVIEWTHFKPSAGVHLRGDEWYRFDADGRILEIRAYYACPPSGADRSHGLGGFDYSGRGYPIEPPVIPGRDG